VVQGHSQIFSRNADDHQTKCAQDLDTPRI
jgi:hypothetical protein